MNVRYNELSHAQQTLISEFRTVCWDGRTVNWFWEANGNWGKTQAAKYMVDYMDAVYVAGKAADIKYCIQSYIMKFKRSPPIVILDIPRTKSDYINYTAMEEVKNGIFFSTKYESVGVRFNAPHLIVFANVAPDLASMSQDR